mgnify:CR=1 FL=1
MDQKEGTQKEFYKETELIRFSEDVVFSYDPNKFIKPWSIKAQLSDRVNIQFVPFYERIAKTNLLILESDDHQLFGRFSGTIIPDTGTSVQIKDII